MSEQPHDLSHEAVDVPAPRNHPLEELMHGDEPVAVLVRSLERVLAGDFGLPQDGTFGWAPLPIPDFMEGIQFAEKHLREHMTELDDKPLRFLDVGCGIGSKVLLASCLGWEAYGFDRDEEYVRKAKRLLGRRGEVWIDDAREFASYQSFDVVYMFHPLASDEDQARLNAHVASNMAPHAIFFCPGAIFPAGLERLEVNLWR